MSEETNGTIRRALSRHCKDKAMARIHMPILNSSSPPRIKLKRSQSLRVDRNLDNKENIQSDNESDDEYNEVESVYSDISENESSCSSEESLILKPPPKTPIKRSCTISTPGRRSRKSISVPNRKSRIAMVTNEMERLPCREKEYDLIFEFVYEKIRSSTGGCLFISGLPGTGKTATVMRVLNSLQAEQKSLDISEFDRIQLNGMEISELKQIYQEFMLQLVGIKYSIKKSRETMRSMFGVKTKRFVKCCVLVIDEVDQLCHQGSRSKQDVVYELLDWAQNAGSKLIIVAIANTMDLPDRYLQNKVSSRIGFARITFKPYSNKQLEEIIKVRLGKEKTQKFQPQAVTFVAMKVSASSGDARRAIDICSRALELHIEDSDKDNNFISVSDVDKIIKSMFTSPFLFAIQNRCSIMEKMLLRAILVTFKSLGVEEANFRQVQQKFQEVCKNEGYVAIKSDLLMKVIMSLEQQGFLAYDSMDRDVNMQIKLRVRSADVEFALE